MDLLGSLKSYFKTKYVITDNLMCRMHHKASVGILVAFSLLVTGKQYVGDPIDCISKDAVPPRLLDTYCWIHKTFSVSTAWKGKVGDEVAYPGIAPHIEGEPRVYHGYYQWVCFVLLLQAMFFYIPRYIWKTIEGNRVHSLTEQLSTPMQEKATLDKARDMVVDYLVSNRGNHCGYFLAFVFTEVLYFVNVVAQIFVMDRFLGGEFSTYGWRVLQFTEWHWEARYDPMIQVFPRMTKCTFHMFGTSGDIQKHDAVCVLPINIINEKIYVFLWFWFVILSIITGLFLIYRLVVIVSSSVRFHIMYSRNRNVHSQKLREIVQAISSADWFILYQMSKNIDPGNMREFIDEYYQMMDDKHKDSRQKLK
ncbi:innexin inx2-like [Amblyomma americanum]